MWAGKNGLSGSGGLAVGLLCCSVVASGRLI